MHGAKGPYCGRHGLVHIFQSSNFPLTKSQYPPLSVNVPFTTALLTNGYVSRFPIEFFTDSCIYTYNEVKILFPFQPRNLNILQVGACYTFSQSVNCCSKGRSPASSSTFFFAGKPIFTHSSMKSLPSSSQNKMFLYFISKMVIFISNNSLLCLSLIWKTHKPLYATTTTMSHYQYVVHL